MSPLFVSTLRVLPAYGPVLNPGRRDKPDPGWLKSVNPERSTLVAFVRLTSRHPRAAPP
jgi:hypothetical protein